VTNCNQNSYQFSSLNRKKIIANFNGGAIGSDGGLLLEQFPLLLIHFRASIMAFGEAKDVKKCAVYAK
jgi:hypothetical protein